MLVSITDAVAQAQPSASQQTASAMIQQARGLMAQGRYQNARPILQQVTDSFPVQAEAWYWSAIVSEKLGDLERAINEVARSSELAPKNVRLLLEHGRLLGQAARFEEAEIIYLKAIAAAPDGTLRSEAERSYDLLFAQKLISEQNFDEAIAYYKKMLSRTPDDQVIADTLGRLYLNLKRWKEAEDVFARVAAGKDTAVVLAATWQLIGIAENTANNDRRRDLLKRVLTLDPNGKHGEAAISALLSDGRAALEKGRADEAVKAFNAIRDVLPKHDVANLAAAESYELLKDYDSAVTAYVAAVAAHPEDLTARSSLARLYVKAERLDEAIEAFKEIIDRGPNTTTAREARANLGIVYGMKAARVAKEMTAEDDATKFVAMAREWLNAGHQEPAQKVLEAVLEKHPDSAEAHYWLGTIHDQRSEFDAAIEHVARSFALAPDNFRLLKALGQVFARAGLLAQSEAVYQEVLRMASGMEAETKETEMLLGLVVGQRLVAEGRLDEALRHYNEMRQNYPDDVSLLGRIGSVHLRKGELDRAEALFRESLERDPNNANIYMRLVRLYERRGDNEARLEALKRVVELDSSGSLGYAAVGELGLREGLNRLRQRQWVEAVEAFHRVLAVDPKNVFANLGLSDAYIETGRYDDAEKLLQGLLESDPSSMEARLRLARVLLASGRRDESAIELERIAAVTKDSSVGRRAAVNLANIYRERAKQLADAGEYRDAVTEYRRAIAKDKDDFNAHLELSSIYQRAGLRDAALEEYLQLVRIDPNYARAYVDIGSAYEGKNDAENAIKYYAQALSLEQPEAIVKRLVTALRLQEVRRQFEVEDFDWALQELADMMEYDDSDSRLFFYRSIIYTRRSEFDNAIADLREVLARSPNNITANYRLGLLYEQTSADELALEQYRTILRSGNKGPTVEDARERLRMVSERLRVFSYALDYQVATGGNKMPGVPTSTSFSSTLNFNLSTRFRPRKDVNLSITAAPSYSGYHLRESDSLAQSVAINGQWNRPDTFYSASANYRETETLILEDFNGRSKGVSLSAARRLLIPLFLSEEGQAIPKTLQLRLSANEFESEDVTLFQTRTITAATSFTYPFQRGISVTAGYDFSYVANLNPLGRDYANRAHGGSLNVSLPLMTRLSAQFNGSVKLANYIHPDSYHFWVVNLGEERWRKVGQISLSAGLRYQLHRNVAIMANASYSDNRSDMERGYIVVIKNRRLDAAGVQSSALGDYSTYNASIGFNFRF